MKVVLDDVSILYRAQHRPRHMVFEHLSLRIASGERVGIIGPEGAGKSTLLQVLDGLHRPETGNVVLDGCDIWAKPDALPSLRSSIGYAFQFPEQQFFGETVFEELTFGLRCRGEKVSPDDVRCRDVLESVGMDPGHTLRRSPFSLSMGEARRVAIASVLMGHPRLLLLDEPTAGLDAEGIGTILSAVSQTHTKGMTIVLVSHDIDVLGEAVDRLVILDGGSVVDDRPVGALLMDESRLAVYGYDPPETMQLIEEMRKAGAAIPRRYYRREEVREVLRKSMVTGKPPRPSAPQE
jgi:energy-coupling factor transport system ATP-binding protein